MLNIVGQGSFGRSENLAYFTRVIKILCAVKFRFKARVYVLKMASAWRVFICFHSGMDAILMQ